MGIQTHLTLVLFSRLHKVVVKMSVRILDHLGSQQVKTACKLIQAIFSYLWLYNAGDPGLIPGSGRSPGEGNGNPLQYSCLENSMDGGAW